MGNEDGTRPGRLQRRDLQLHRTARGTEDVRPSFRTRSDTEVIVHAYEQWGQDCVTSDSTGCLRSPSGTRERRELFLARDHLGIKPLYYSSSAAQSCSPRRSRRCCRTRAVRAKWISTRWRSCSRSATCLRRRRCSKALEAAAGPPDARLARGIEVERYWNWVPRPPDATVTRRLIEEYQALLEDAVRLQLRSDVPLGSVPQLGRRFGRLAGHHEPAFVGAGRSIHHRLRGR